MLRIGIRSRVPRLEGSLPGGHGVWHIETLEQRLLLSRLSFSGQPVTGDYPTAVVAADFDGDGKLDLATANMWANTVSVLLGRGDGTFQIKKDARTGDGPISLAAGNFNGDGNVDLVIANDYDGTVSILLGLGDGTFSPKTDLVTGGSPMSVVAADFNDDAHLDFAIADSSNSNVLIFLGAGDGTFAPQASLSVDGQPVSVAAADINSDGTIDLVSANIGTQKVSVMIGVGDGTFLPSTSFATGGSPSSVVAADLNNDGKPDLAVANGNSKSYSLSVLIGDGNGAFGAHTEFQTGCYARTIVAVDFNGDGNIDLATADQGTSDHLYDGVSILMGNGTGSFQRRTFPGGLEPRGLTAADINADGEIDLAVVAGGEDAVWTILGKGDGTFHASNDFGIVGMPDTIQSADIDGDGNLDLVTTGQTPDFGSGGSMDTSILLGNGDGTFGAPTRVDDGIRVVTADFNADGKMDIATCHIWSPVFSILLGNGDGTFQPRIDRNMRQGETYGYASVQAAADFNGDGCMDLLVTQYYFIYMASEQDAYILLGNGDGTFGSRQLVDSWTYSIGGANETELADINGDSKLDIVTVEGTSIVSYLGNGDGTFHVGGNFGNLNLDPDDLAVADVNSDGLPDVVSSGNSLWVNLGNGDGTFRSGVRLSGGLSGVAGEVMTVADVDLDGKPDVVASNLFSPGLCIFPGNGDGTFRTRIDLALRNSACDFVAIDLNKDNKADLVTASREDSSPFGFASVLLNQSSPNHGPVAGDDTIAIDQGSPTSIVDVLANDSDADSDTLTVTAVGAAPHGLAARVNGKVTYRPYSDYYGPDSFTYTITDDFGGTAVATVNVTVVQDTTAPSPDPSTWATLPYATGFNSIAMQATLAADTNGVEYYFHCLTEGGHDSGWQYSVYYQDVGLSPATTYTYQVRTRDMTFGQNTGSYSEEASATTLRPDVTAPGPDPATWATAPYAISSYQISMTATTAVDAGGNAVQYYFQCMTPGGHDSGWQDSPTFADFGLSPQTTYVYRVMSRDLSSNQNAGEYSEPAWATTSVAPDVQMGLDAAGKLRYVDGDGSVVTIRLTGGGTATVFFPWLGWCDARQIVLSDTTTKSVLTITTTGPGNGTMISGIDTQGWPIAKITAGTTDVTGSISIGPSFNPKASVVLAFDQITNATITSSMPVKSLTATEWIDDDATPDVFTAPVAGTIAISGKKANLRAGIAAACGDFQADLDVGLPGNTSLAISSLSVAGVIDGSTITARAHDAKGVAIGVFKAGRVGNVAVVADGGVNTISVSHWQAGKIAAGWVGSIGTKANAILGGLGHFGAGLVLTGLALPARKATLGSVKIAGDLLDGSQWDIRSGCIGSITIKGTADHGLIRSAGDIGSITVGASNVSDFGAGVGFDLLQTSGHVAVSDAVNAPTGTIKTFTVKGWKVPSGQAIPRFFIGSNISAKVGRFNLLNWDDQGGLFAPAGSVKSVVYKDTADKALNWVYPAPSSQVSNGPDDFVNVI